MDTDPDLFTFKSEAHEDIITVKQRSDSTFHSIRFNADSRETLPIIKNEGKMDNLLKQMTMKDIGGLLVSSDQFIDYFNNNEAVLLDVRFPFETRLWGMKFALEIPSDALEERLKELPKDKIIVCACPLEVRSNMVCQYLLQKGFKAKILMGGLLGLADRLRGGAANDLKL